MTKQDILNGKKFQILSYGTTMDSFIYQFEKDDNSSKIVTYYDLSDELRFWEVNIIEKITDKYITVSKVILNQLVQVKVKIEDLVPYEGRLITDKEIENQFSL